MTDKKSKALMMADYLEIANDKYGIDWENIHAAAAELRRLHEVCRDVYEVWAGSEGIPMPQTASEAYLLSLVEQMRDASKEGLK